MAYMWNRQDRPASVLSEMAGEIREAATRKEADAASLRTKADDFEAEAKLLRSQAEEFEAAAGLIFKIYPGALPELKKNIYGLGFSKSRA